MKDYIVTCDHDVIITVFAQGYEIRNRSNRFTGVLLFFCSGNVVACFSMKDIVEVEICDGIDTLEKVFVNE